MSPSVALASLANMVSEGDSVLLRHPMGRRAGRVLGLLSIRTKSRVAVHRNLRTTALCGLDAKSRHTFTLRTAWAMRWSTMK